MFLESPKKKLVGSMLRVKYNFAGQHEEEDSEGEEMVLIKKLKAILDYPGRAVEDDLEKLFMKHNKFVLRSKNNVYNKRRADRSAEVRKGQKSVDLNSRSFHFHNKEKKPLSINSRGKSQDNRRGEAGTHRRQNWMTKKIRKKFKRDLFNHKKKFLELPEPGNKYEDHYQLDLPDSLNKKENLWLLKVASYNRGFGIELFTDLKSFFVHLYNFWMGYEECINENQSYYQGKCGVNPSQVDHAEPQGRNEHPKHSERTGRQAISESAGHVRMPQQKRK